MKSQKMLSKDELFQNEALSGPENTDQPAEGSSKTAGPWREFYPTTRRGSRRQVINCLDVQGFGDPQYWKPSMGI